MEAADRFKPQFILVSAGFDMHQKDPLNRAPGAGANYVPLEVDDFRTTAALLMDLSRHHCSGRLVSILEGGYNLDMLGPSAAAHVGELLK